MWVHRVSVFCWATHWWITVHFIPPEQIFHRTFTFIYGTVVAFATLNQYVSHKIVQCHSQRTECLPKFQHGHKLKKIKNKCNFNRDIHTTYWAAIGSQLQPNMFQAISFLIEKLNLDLIQSVHHAREITAVNGNTGCDLAWLPICAVPPTYM